MNAKPPTLDSRIAINGMGRIGRNLLRLLIQKGLHHQVVAINDVMSKENLLYLLKYDSIRGPLENEVRITDSGLAINDHELLVLQEAERSKLAWGKLEIDTVVEATGLFTLQHEATTHLTSGAKRVLLTTFSKDVPSMVWGVNSSEFAGQRIISPGDCTINSVAPVVQALDRTFGVASLHINVIQGYTTRQELLDKPYKGFRRGRSAASSIIPFDVNIAPVLEQLLPSLVGKVEAMSTRVPIPCGASAHLSVMLQNSTSAAAVNSLFSELAVGSLKDILSITFDPIVSTDILGNRHSGMIDGLLTKVTDQRHLRLMVWFDNEWGYANRLYDWLIALQMKKG